MSERDTIKNKFSNFEPEVEDAHIEQNWEKVKYFVPQKEKKRRGIFFWLTGHSTGVTTAFVVIGALIAFYMFNAKPEQETQVVQQTNSKQEIVDTKETKSETLIDSKDKAITNQLPINESTPIEHSTNRNTYKGTIITLKTSVKEMESEMKKTGLAESSNSKKYSKQISSGVNTKHVITSSIASNSIQTNDNTIVYNSAPNQVIEEPFFLLMQPTPLLNELNESELILNNNVTPSIEKIKYKPTLYVYAIGGANSTNNQFNDLKTPVKDSKNTFNYNGGIGIMYALQKRFYLVSQLTYGSNSFTKTEQINQNKIISKQLGLSGSVNAFLPDTIRYQEVKTEYRLQVKSSYHFALGFEYEAAKWQKFSIGVFALGNVAYTQLNQVQESSYDSPVLKFLTTPTDTILPNQAPNDFKEEQLKQTSYLSAYGINTGVSLNYALTPRLAITTRPSYGIQLSNDTKNWLKHSFQLKQHQLFLNLGIRFKL